MKLDHKAISALIEAARFQLAAWEKTSPDEMDEDDFADMTNDMGYLGSVVTMLEEELQRLHSERAASEPG